MNTESIEKTSGQQDAQFVPRAVKLSAPQAGAWPDSSAEQPEKIPVKPFEIVKRQQTARVFPVVPLQAGHTPGPVPVKCGASFQRRGAITVGGRLAGRRSLSIIPAPLPLIIEQ